MPTESGYLVSIKDGCIKPVRESEVSGKRKKDPARTLGYSHQSYTLLPVYNNIYNAYTFASREMKSREIRGWANNP